MLTRRPSRVYVLVAAALCLTGGAALPARAQSLAEVAKKEESRRQNVAEPTKVYTNKDLNRAGEGAPAPAPSAAQSTPTTEPPKDTIDATAKVGDTDAKTPVKDQAYWSGKLKGLQAQLEQDQALSEAVQTRINSLTTDSVNRDDPIQRGKLERDRQKAIAELARLAKAIEVDKKAVATLMEDARRAGVPPGWLR